MNRVLYIQPWNTSSYDDVPDILASVEGLMIPRAMFEVAWRVTEYGHGVDLLDCNLIALSNSKSPVPAIEHAIAGYLSKHQYQSVFISWPTVAQGNIIRHVAAAASHLAQSSVTNIVVGGGALDVLRSTVPGILANSFYMGDGAEIPQLLQTADGMDIPGILYDGSCKAPRRELLDGYDAAAFYTVRGTFDFKQYLDTYRVIGIRPIGLLEMMRGCPYACSYCAIRGEVAGVRYRHPRTVAAEAELLLRFGVDRHYVIDPTFGLNKKKTDQLLGFFTDLKKRNPSFGWWGITRCDRITEELAPRLRAAGADTMSIGVETMDQTTLDDVHKRTSSHASEKAVQILQEAGIAARLLLMHFPEVFDSQTIKFLLEVQMKGDIITQSSMLRPLYTPEHRRHEREDVDFRRCDHEVDGRAAGLDTESSILGYLLVNLAFPSTSIRPDGDGALRERLRQTDLDLWFRAANADPDAFDRQEKLALGLFRVGYACAEAKERTSRLLATSIAQARQVTESVRRQLLKGVPKRKVPAEWFGIVASIDPPRWYYRPVSANPFPQLWSNIKVGEDLEDLDRLVFENVERR